MYGFGLGVEYPTWLLRLTAKIAGLIRRVQDPCPHRHPEYGWRCGDWEYARQHNLYRKGHKGLHSAVGHPDPNNRNGISVQWFST